MKVKSNLHPTLIFLLVAQFMLGVFRIQIVPLSYNVDEIIHFANTKLVAAACIRDTLGLSWSLHQNNSIIGENVTEWIAFNDREKSNIDPSNPNSKPCHLIFDNRRLTNSAYYIWSSIPIAAFNNLADRPTINLSRFFTLLLGMSATCLSYLAVKNWFPSKQLLHISSASILTLNHQWSDISSGLNTDAGAMFSITLLFWSLSKINSTTLKYHSMIRIIPALILCLFTKSTAWIGIPITIIYLLANLPISQRKWMLTTLALGITIAIPILLTIKQNIPAHWFWYEPNKPIRFIAAEFIDRSGPAGPNALIVDPQENYHGIVQYIEDNKIENLRGKNITIGGWTKLDKGSQIQFPNFSTDDGGYSHTTTGTGEWQFQTIVKQVPINANYLAIILPASNNDSIVLYDGLTVTIGNHTNKQASHLTSNKDTIKVWGKETISGNMVRNSTVETMWPNIQRKHIFGFSPNRALWSLYSWERTHPVWLRDLPSWLFAMYWSGFGGTQPGLNRLQLIPFLIITALGLCGIVRQTYLGNHKIKYAKHNYQMTIFFLIICTMLIFIMVILRTDIYPHQANMLMFAGTRYSLPAMLPTSILLTLGWINIIPRRYHKITIGIVVALLFLTNVFIIFNTQIPFYNCQLESAIKCLYP